MSFCPMEIDEAPVTQVAPSQVSPARPQLSSISQTFIPQHHGYTPLVLETPMPLTIAQRKTLSERAQKILATRIAIARLQIEAFESRTRETYELNLTQQKACMESKIREMEYSMRMEQLKVELDENMVSMVETMDTQEPLDQSVDQPLDQPQEVQIEGLRKPALKRTHRMI